MRRRGVRHQNDAPHDFELRWSIMGTMENRSLLQRMSQAPRPSVPVLIISKIFMVALPITQVAIGSVYLKDCPAQHYIPVYVLVSGVFALVLSLLSCLPCAQEPEDGGSSPLGSLCTAWNSTVTLFLFCWFIAGNIWIYSIYQPSYIPGAENYCSKTLYLFAFWTTTLVYILLGMLFVLGCCALLLCGRGGFGTESDV
uniref:Uncharacterized protein n=1 Tax=Denticeps clupeoides TaxID=299321 RepID=A0AAY4EFX2_9TELE